MLPIWDDNLIFDWRQRVRKVRGKKNKPKVVKPASSSSSSSSKSSSDSEYERKEKKHQRRDRKQPKTKVETSRKQQVAKAKWSNEDIFRLIDPYEERSCLWDVFSPTYHDRTMTGKAKQEIDVRL